MRALVEIKGGFGNQLFQLAFANHLKHLGFKVTLNLEKNNNKSMALNYEHFGFKKSNILLIKITRFLYRISQGNKGKYFFRLLFSKFFDKKSKIEQFDENNKKYLTHFDGYWQDVKILEEQKKYLISCLSKSENFETPLDKNTIPGSTLVHVRKGDYKSLNEDLHITYFQEAIDYAKKHIDNFSFEVFTDDIEWVNNQKIFSEAKYIHSPNQTQASILIDVSKMLNFENYIISNSSFSLTAAILGEKKNSIVILPTPWMKHTKADPKNLKYAWKKIKNQF